MSPELLDGSRTEMPEGRQRMIKIFPLKNVQAGELREKLRAVLTERAHRHRRPCQPAHRH